MLWSLVISNPVVCDKVQVPESKLQCGEHQFAATFRARRRTQLPGISFPRLAQPIILRKYRILNDS